MNPKCGGVNKAALSQNSNRLENGSETQYLWALLTLELRGIQPDGTIENRRLDGLDRLRQFGLDSQMSGLAFSELALNRLRPSPRNEVRSNFLHSSDGHKPSLLFFLPVRCCSKKHGNHLKVNSRKFKQIEQDSESRCWDVV